MIFHPFIGFTPYPLNNGRKIYSFENVLYWGLFTIFFSAPFRRALPGAKIYTSRESSDTKGIGMSVLL